MLIKQEKGVHRCSNTESRVSNLFESTHFELQPRLSASEPQRLLRF